MPRRPPPTDPDHLPPARPRADFQPGFSELEPRLLLATGAFAQPTPSDLAIALPIVLGDPVSGDLAVAQAAIYRFEVTDSSLSGFQVTPPTTRVVARVVAPGSEISLSLFDATGRRLLESDGTSPSDRDGQISLALDLGIYYLAVQSSGSSAGAFTLDTSALPVVSEFSSPIGDHFAPGSQIGTGDFDGDGKLDLITTGGVFLGQGDGTFYQVSFGFNASAFAVGDFEGDGRSETAIAGDGIDIQSIFPIIGANGLSQVIDTGPDLNPGGREGMRFRDITTGDFNGDGIPDLAATAPYENQVVILLGLGSGQFAAPTWLSTPDFPFALTATDLNGDGRDDLVVTQPTVDAVSVFQSLGGGQFAAPEILPVGDGPIAVRAVDLNRDHRPDLVVADFGSSDVAILTNQGNMTFAAPLPLPVGTAPLNVVTGDFNGDGVPDIATSSAAGVVSSLDSGIQSLYPGEPPSRDITLLLGQGDGRTFDTSRISNFPASSGLGPVSIEPGDFDGDGRLDLAVAAYNGNILFGRGDGSFRSVSHVRTGSSTSQVMSGDFNNDGRPDIISVGTGSNDISVNLGRGDGNLADPIRTQVGTLPYRIALGDFNHDGRLDFAVACFGPQFFTGGTSSSGSITIGLGRGDGSFLTQDIELPGGDTPYSIAVGDFNGDGQLDLAASNIGEQDLVFIALGRGDGTFTLTTPQPGFGFLGDLAMTTLASADLNHDGHADLVELSGTGFVVYLGRGDGTFDPTAYPDGGFLGITPHLVDLNGDGAPDLSADLGNDARGLIAVAYNKGDGTFDPLEFFGGEGDPNGTDRSIGEGGAVGDFDGDGRLDIIVGLSNTNGTTAILHNLGNGNFERIPGPTFDRNSVPGALAAVDLNGDGRTDIVAATYGSDDLPTFLNLGNNQFFDPSTARPRSK